MIILGIDPGTQVLGYGAIEKTGSQISYLDHGFLRIKQKADFVPRLSIMAQMVSDLVSKIKPDILVIEKIFLGRNVDSAFKLGHIRGICIFEGQKHGAEIVEYSPRSVKLGITGSGSASKEQVQMLLYSQLNIRNTARAEITNTDASDGLALAFHHAGQMDVLRKLRGSGVDL